MNNILSVKKIFNHRDEYRKRYLEDAERKNMIIKKMIEIINLNYKKLSK